MTVCCPMSLVASQGQCTICIPQAKERVERLAAEKQRLTGNITLLHITITYYTDCYSLICFQTSQRHRL